MKAHGLCVAHYMKRRRRGDVPARVALYPMQATFTEVQLRTLNATARENGIATTTLLRNVVQAWMDGKSLDVTPTKPRGGP